MITYISYNPINLSGSFVNQVNYLTLQFHDNRNKIESGKVNTTERRETFRQVSQGLGLGFGTQT